MHREARKKNEKQKQREATKFEKQPKKQTKNEKQQKTAGRDAKNREARFKIQDTRFITIINYTIVGLRFRC